jgi:hypothetical protein
MALQKMGIQNKKTRKPEKIVRKSNNKYIYFIIPAFLTISSCSIQQQLSENHYIHVGEVILNFEQYNVFNSYRKIKTATSSKGNSKLIFTSSTKSFEYNLDGKEDFIDSIVGNKFYNDSEFTIIDSLSSIICLPTGCFELEK